MILSIKNIFTKLLFGYTITYHVDHMGYKTKVKRQKFKAKPKPLKFNYSSTSVQTVDRNNSSKIF